ncbi:MAG TPA: hypothetical protein DEO32_05385 [Ruminococcaceae bacterium]|nr:hypothetical protein [Oscillospiraceae bacterium]
MKKPDKRENINLFFSAFLLIAFIVCANFFSQFTKTVQSPIGQIITLAVCAVFGLLLFYATRVGDGKAVRRFSPLTLIILVLPTLYIMIASIGEFMPLHSVFVENNSFSIVVYLAAVAFGYGIPYTFFSGFELQAEETADAEGENEVLSGGVEQDVISENENSDTLEDEQDMMDDYVEEN